MSRLNIIPWQIRSTMLRQLSTTAKAVTPPHLATFSLRQIIQKHYQTSLFRSSPQWPLHSSSPTRSTAQSALLATALRPLTPRTTLTGHRFTSTNTAPNGTGPLLSRRADRPLPPIPSASRIWLRTLPLFALLITVSTLAIFNYQKSSSSVVSSILYALRRSPEAREILGDEIYFASSVPWIRGEINQLHGRIDVKFWVKGTKGKGEVEYKCERRGGRGGVFEALEWKLKGEGGEVVELLESGAVMPEA